MSAAHLTSRRRLRLAFPPIVPDDPNLIHSGLARRARVQLAQPYGSVVAGAALVDELGAVLVAALAAFVTLRHAADHEAEEIRERARGWLAELEARADLEARPGIGGEA